LPEKAFANAKNCKEVRENAPMEGNPTDRPKAPEVEFFTKEFLHEEVKIY
jgi:hypothetical protein